ncbi:hypothetical protein MA16_Dca028364 [Dendrobium catenatum]|uniref:Uncharacterized protein n=1 Tax=Dendrobium catenatum TaxID=906689 RepID=A0A2I0V9A4_9ASPA|nr:hypothetical protein MA16_Dca028364 [Dendrobium catenatum]
MDKIITKRPLVNIFPSHLQRKLIQPLVFSLYASGCGLSWMKLRSEFINMATNSQAPRISRATTFLTEYEP